MDNTQNIHSKHQKLYSNWKGNCIICGKNKPNQKDHIPPKALLPKELRDYKTEFLTFPVCKNCNNGSSDNDLILTLYIFLKLNNELYSGSSKNHEENRDLQVLNLYIENSINKHKKLISKYFSILNYKESLATFKIELLYPTLTKIVKSIYWLHTDGDILQNYNPGWWLLSDIDPTSTSSLKYLFNTDIHIHWDNRFITHDKIGLPESGVGGLICCSLHFYTNNELGKGIIFKLLAAPKKTIVNKESLFDLVKTVIGFPTIPPS